MEVKPGVYAISLLKSKDGMYTIVIPMENFTKAADVHFGALEGILIHVSETIPDYGKCPTAVYNIVEIHDDYEKPYQTLWNEAVDCMDTWGTVGIMGMADYEEVI